MRLEGVLGCDGVVEVSAGQAVREGRLVVVELPLLGVDGPEVCQWLCAVLNFSGLVYALSLYDLRAFPLEAGQDARVVGEVVSGVPRNLVPYCGQWHSQSQGTIDAVG